MKYRKIVNGECHIQILKLHKGMFSVRDEDLNQYGSVVVGYGEQQYRVKKELSPVRVQEKESNIGRPYSLYFYKWPKAENKHQMELF